MGQSTPISGVRHDPKTKEDLLNRMMSRDFSGDISDLAVGRGLQMERIRPNAIRLKFSDSGQTFDLTIHKPRSESTVAKSAQTSTAAEAQAGRAASTRKASRKRAGPNARH